jgi:hypothetical protein
LVQRNLYITTPSNFALTIDNYYIGFYYLIWKLFDFIHVYLKSKIGSVKNWTKKDNLLYFYLKLYLYNKYNTVNKKNITLLISLNKSQSYFI